jgi:hypothetical protein
VRVARAAESPRAEQGAAKVGGGAAAPRDHAARRPVERPVGAVEDARSVEGLVCLGGSRDVELVAGRPVEGAPRVGADL